MIGPIEAVTVSVNYGDFLRETLPINLPLVDRMVVVTVSTDEETRETCRRLRAECVMVDEGIRDGKFNKGWMVERGLQHLSGDGLRVHIDADIALPGHFRSAIEHSDLEDDAIYGCDRILCKSWNDWIKLKDSGYLSELRQYNCNHLQFPHGYDIGARWIGKNVGYCCIGFFQAWFAKADEWRGHRIRPYPSRHGNCCRGDVQMALTFQRRKRILIPELLVVHLESEESACGTNWSGRKTKRFGPSKAEKVPHTES